MEEPGRGGGDRRRHLAQRCDVVEDPDAAAVRADHQIVVLHHEIAHRRDREVEAQRLPVVPVVERELDPLFRRGVEHALAHRVLAHGVDEMAVGDAVDDELPALAAVMRAVNVGLAVVEAVPINRDVSGFGIEVRGLDDADLGPRRERFRGDILPTTAVIAGARDTVIPAERA